MGIKQSIGKRRFKISSYKSISGAASQLCELWEKKPLFRILIAINDYSQIICVSLHSNGNTMFSDDKA